jgi:imidazolonepropionase
VPSRTAIIHASALCRISDGGGPRRGASQDELDIVPDGALVMEAGAIVDVGTTADVSARNDLAGADVFDASGMTVLPGLVEAHSHPVFAGSRYMEYARRLSGASLDEIVAEGGGIWNSVLATRSASDQELRTQLRVALQRMLEDGITTAELKSGYGLTPRQELRSLRIIADEASRSTVAVVPTFLGAHVVPAGMSTEDYVTQICDEMLPAVAEQGIARFCDVTCEVGYFDQQQAERCIQSAKEFGLPVRIHADAWKPSGGWALAARLGAHTADHVTFATDDEIRASRGSDTIAVLLPVAECVYMGDKRANARLLIDSDIPVVVATDYCSSIPVLSLRFAVGLATAWFAMRPGEAIVGATLNAAYAVGTAAEIGSLDPGKRGDVLVLPVEHPFQFAWQLGQTPVRRVYKDGKVVVDRRS